MEFPIEIQRIINEYAKPCTRPDWRMGCYYNRCILHYNQWSRCTCRYKYKDIINTLYHTHINNHRHHDNLYELIVYTYIL
jgi:hypothetical protein